MSYSDCLDYSRSTVAQHSSCRHDRHHKMYELVNAFNYRSSTCGALCQLLATLRECGCVWERYDELHLFYFLRKKDEKGRECIMEVR